MLSCVAVIVVVPAPTIVIVFPSTVATLGAELVYVYAPELGEAGLVIWNGTSPGLPKRYCRFYIMRMKFRCKLPKLPSMILMRFGIKTITKPWGIKSGFLLKILN